WISGGSRLRTCGRLRASFKVGMTTDTRYPGVLKSAFAVMGPLHDWRRNERGVALGSALPRTSPGPIRLSLIRLVSVYAYVTGSHPAPPVSRERPPSVTFCNPRPA